MRAPGIEETFIQRAIPIEIEGLSVPVVSPEDLIVMKILAARPKDIEDVRAVLAERLDTLDLSYVKEVLGTLESALGQSDLLPVMTAELDRSRRRGR